MATGYGVAPSGIYTEEKESSMKDNAMKGSKAAATANEQSKTISTTTEEKAMDNRKSTQYSVPASTVLTSMSAKDMLNFIADEADKGYAVTPVCYAVYWGLLKELRKKAFALTGVANFQLAKNRENKDYVSKSVNQYQDIADHLESLYARYDQHVGFLNAILNDIHQKRPARRITRNGESINTEEYRPLTLEPFTRRMVMNGASEGDCANAWDVMDDDEMADYGDEQAERELERFMAQHDLKSPKGNASQAINDDEQVIYEPISKEHWVDDMCDRDMDTIIEDAKMGAWAMLRALGRKFSTNSWVKELVKDSLLEDVDWDTATGGKALSLAVKMNSRRISSLNFVQSLEERIAQLNDYRAQRENQDKGTIGESSLPVSGAKHDEQIMEYEAMIKDSNREISVYTPMCAQLYEAARLFGTTEERPVPDYRTAFQKDPADYMEMLTADMTIEQIEVDVERKGKTLKKPIWLAVAFGDDDHCRKVAEQCRQVRYEMTKHEQVLAVRALSEDEKVSTDTLDITELSAAIDSLLD